MTEDNERNPEIVHALDQSAAEFNNNRDEFEAKYGFEHTCTCDTDYTSGRTGEVTFCFAGLLTDALNACERLHAENQRLETMLGEALAIIDAVQPLVKERLEPNESDDATERELDEAAEGLGTEGD